MLVLLLLFVKVVKEEETIKKILLFLIILVSLLSIRTLNAATLADTNASAKATAIYNYIVDLPNHTQRVISGQWVGTDKTFLNSGFGDAQTIYDETGHWPGLIGAEYINWHTGDPGYGTVQYSNTNLALISYWNAGGLVQVENHFFNPHTVGNYSDRDFGDLGDLLVAGTTRTNWLRMLDAVAAGLQELQNAGVVVLWRPFHEMNYGWFWWGGQDPHTFKAVWQDMFNYFTVTKGLHNLIWVYAPNAGSDVDTYYPGSAYADIVGLDGYTDKVDTANLPGYSTLQALKKPFSFPEFGPATASSCPGTFDDMDLINGIKADFPNTIYWMSWRANQSIHCGLNATSLMTDSWVVNRDSNPSQQGGGSPRTIYVSVNGNDNNSCDIATTALNDNTKAKRNIVTPNGGLSCLSAGDTLDIRAGTYSEMMRSVTITIPSGTSDTQRTTIRGHAGETVNVSCIEITQTSAQFIIFDNLHIDGSLAGCSGMAGQAGFYYTNGANHILISNGEIKNANDMGMLAGYQSGTSNIEVANMDIHNNGQASRITSENGHCCYGIYAEGTDFSVHHSKIHDNPGYGIHINCSGCGSSIARVRIYSNKIYGNGGSESTQFGTLCEGSDCRIFLNEVYGNLAGLQLLGCTNCLIYENSIYNNNKTAAGYAGIQITEASSNGTIIRNNILRSNGSNGIEDYGTNTIKDHNMCDSAATGCGVTGNPLFIDTTAGSEDLALQAGSPAIDAGISAISGIVTVGFNGSAPDIGAFETMTFLACSITGNTITVTLNMIPGQSPLSGISTAGSTVTIDGIVRTPLSNAVAVGNNGFSMTYPGATPISTVTWAYAPGTLADSANIGGKNQRLNTITAQPCTVSGGVGGGGMSVYYVGQGSGDSDSNSCDSAKTDADGYRKRNFTGANGGSLASAWPSNCLGVTLDVHTLLF